MPERKPAARRLFFTGRVQGIGMRPAIARLAKSLGLCGYVTNCTGGVEVVIEGPSEVVAAFEEQLWQWIPKQADVQECSCRNVPPSGFRDFCIRTASVNGQQSDQLCRPEIGAPSRMSCRVPVDVRVCEACLSDVTSADNRRYGYPFTTCSECGPRYSILERMPYERRHTAMAQFELCAGCQGEYTSVFDRRYHAESIACGNCGPKLLLCDESGRAIAVGSEALEEAVNKLKQGQIVALRGIGGYQLLCDARSYEAVERLRQRKQRPAKPLAILVDSAESARQWARLSNEERELLTSAAGPIVVVQQRNCRLASNVNLHCPTVGLLLPTSPLHWMVVRAFGGPLVCTSGNVEGDPLVYRHDSARVALQRVADVWLEHDRPIIRPIDDSLVQVASGRAMVLRLARGYAPWPLEVKTSHELVALGGHQKTSLALASPAQAILGPHIGDLDTVASTQRFVESVNELVKLYGLKKPLLVCDLHPNYFTTRWAVDQRTDLIRVQHHHAHVVSGMLENGWIDRQVVGVAFDGTGYGTDGTIWGGEFFLATSIRFERVGCLRPFRLPGAERAVREPWRVATSLVYDVAGPDIAATLRFPSMQAARLLPVLASARLNLWTSSAGRLFDGVAALVLGVEKSQFEGQAAMLLEYSALEDDEWKDYLAEALVAPVRDRGGSWHGSLAKALKPYRIAITDGTPRQLDWRPLISDILHDIGRGVAPARMALRFHAAVADAIFRFCQRYAELPVVLSGGVFQNRLLIRLLFEHFQTRGQLVGLPGVIPVNDGGLAAGQLAIAAARLQH